MDIRHLKYFLAVAKAKSFTQAAAQLGIHQPPLSMQIKKLEEEIGVELFYRTAQGVILTPAGESFFQETYAIESQINHAVRRVRQIADGEVGELYLGFTGTAILNPLMPKAIQIFQKQYPKVKINLVEESSLFLMNELINNRLDLAIIRPPKDIPDAVQLHQLTQEDLIVVLPQSDQYKSEEIDLEILKEQPFIITPYQKSAGLYEAVMDACQQHGFEPKIGQYAPQIVSILSLVAANLGVSLVPQSTQQLEIEGVMYKKIKRICPQIPLCFAHKQGAYAQTAVNFSSIVISLLHE